MPPQGAYFYDQDLYNGLFMNTIGGPENGALWSGSLDEAERNHPEVHDKNSPWDEELEGFPRPIPEMELHDVVVKGPAVPVWKPGKQDMIHSKRVIIMVEHPMIDSERGWNIEDQDADEGTNYCKLIYAKDQDDRLRGIIQFEPKDKQARPQPSVEFVCDPRQVVMLTPYMYSSKYGIWKGEPRMLKRPIDLNTPVDALDEDDLE